MRPSESGARRCGHASAKIRHSPTLSRQTTNFLPRNVVGVGRNGSNSNTDATGTQVRGHSFQADARLAGEGVA
eukprot:5280607-Pleurochrysis_carterae.AAC.2